MRSYLSPEEQQKIRDHVYQNFECKHKAQLLCYELSAAGNKLWRIQCRRCGRTLTVNKKDYTEKELNAAPPLDKDKFDDYLAYRNKALQATIDARNEQRRREWFDWYNSYLLTPKWKSKRARVLARAGNVCEGCRQRPAVEVHHLTYERVGDEMLFDLVAVCAECHQKIHQKKDAR